VKDLHRVFPSLAALTSGSGTNRLSGLADLILTTRLLTPEKLTKLLQEDILVFK